MQRLWIWIGLTFITALGAWLRLRGVLDLPPWYDELHTEWVARSSSWDALLRFEQSDPKHMPVGFLLAKLTLWLGPETAPFSDAAVHLCRWPSWVFSVACVPIGYALGRTVASPRLGLLVALLIAVDPVQVDQGQSARMYPIWSALLLAGLAITPRLFATRTLTRSVLVGGLLGIGFCTHPLALAAWLGFAAIATHKLVSDPVHRRENLKCVAVALVTASLLASRGMWRLWQLGDTQRPDIAVAWWAKAFEAIQTVHALASFGPIPLIWIAFASWIVLFDFVRTRPVGAQPATRAPSARTSVALVAATAAAGFALLLPLRDRHWFLAPRYAIAVQPAIWLGIAALPLPIRALDFRRRNLMAWVRVGFLLAFGAMQAWSATHLHETWQWPDKHRVGPATDRIRDAIEPGERVVYAPDWLHLMGAVRQVPIDLELQQRIAAFFPANPRSPVAETAELGQSLPPSPSGVWLLVSNLPETRDPRRVTLAVAALAKHLGAPFEPRKFSARLRPRSLHLIRIRATGIDVQALPPFGSPDGS